MQPDDRVRVLHMIEAGETALDFVKGRACVDLQEDRMLRFALVRAVEVMGEAAGRVSEDLRAGTPQIPWALIVSMRNRLIPAYFDIDHKILWNTATRDIPALLPRLRALVGDG